MTKPGSDGDQAAWARVERLDADRVVRALRDRAGVRLSVDGPCPGGQVGAAYVRWPDGRRSVLTWRPHSLAEDLRAGPFAVSEALRPAGYPAPATEVVAQVGHAVAVVQEFLPGAPVGSLDEGLLDQALALNRLQAGRLADRPDVPALPLHLIHDGPGFCLHEPLRRHNARSAALERRIVAVGAGRPAHLAGVDAVHADFHPGNLLAAGGSLTGVVDWDGAARGDRRLDLVTLRFGVHAGEGAEGGDAAVTRRLDALLDAMPDDVLRTAWAHMSLRMTDWAIRHFAPADVEHWMDLAEQRLS